MEKNFKIFYEEKISDGINNFCKCKIAFECEMSCRLVKSCKTKKKILKICQN